MPRMPKPFPPAPPIDEIDKHQYKPADSQAPVKFPPAPPMCEVNRYQCRPADSQAAVDIKLRILASKLVPQDLISNFEDAIITDTTYLYVDNNGKPGKILALDILPHVITWDVLSDDVKNSILIGIAKQDKLIAGDYIIITENNEIKVSLKAEDIGAITPDIATIMIDDSIKLAVSELETNLTATILAEVDSRLAALKGELVNLVSTKNQELENNLTIWVEDRLADVENSMVTTIDNRLSSSILDCGLVKLEE